MCLTSMSEKMHVNDILGQSDCSAGKDGCWRFVPHNSYPSFWDGSSVRSVTRALWESINGKIPTGYVICHHCDNPWCVNPAHLFCGTQSENMRDAVKKGKMQKSGRKPTDRIRQHVMLDPENYQYLQRASKQQGRSLSDQVNWVFRQYRAHEDNMSAYTEAERLAQ